MLLLEDTNFQIAAVAGNVSGGSVTITEFDSSGCGEVCLVFRTGATPADTSSLSVVKLRCSDTSGSGYEDATTSVVVAAHATNNDAKFIKMTAPATKRYWTATITESVGAAFTYETMYWIGARNGVVPPGLTSYITGFPQHGTD